MKLKPLPLITLGGILVTLLTGLIPHVTAPLVGATYHGFPLAWLVRLVVAPQYFPWRIDAIKLIIDMAFWIAVIGVATSILMMAKRRSPK